MKNYRKPFVYLVTGMSLDGKISNCTKSCTAISSCDNREVLYNSRIIADAVMIGGNTLRLDDSGLTVKSKARQNKRIKLGKTAEPIKVCVISNANDIKTKGDFFDKGDGQKIIFTTNKTSDKKISEIEKKAKVYVLGEEKIELKKALNILFDLGVKKLLVEGGGELIYSMFNEELVDEINLVVGNLIIGGRNSATFVDGEGFNSINAKKVKFISIEKMTNRIVIKAKPVY